MNRLVGKENITALSPWTYSLFKLTYPIIIIIIILILNLGCEIWSMTLREEHRLRVFENRVLRRIFGPKRDEVTGE
jgi:small-conductance mechanosensitive channel